MLQLTQERLPFNSRGNGALLKCYDCGLTDCSQQKTCDDSYDACVKTFVGEILTQ